MSSARGHNRLIIRKFVFITAFQRHSIALPSIIKFATTIGCGPDSAPESSISVNAGPEFEGVLTLSSHLLFFALSSTFCTVSSIHFSFPRSSLTRRSNLQLLLGVHDVTFLASTSLERFAPRSTHSITASTAALEEYRPPSSHQHTH